MPEAINWGAIQPQSGGAGRHLTNAPPPVLSTWKCVKCSAENQGPLEQGCASCGAGKPGRHVEEPLWKVVIDGFDQWWDTEIGSSSTEVYVACRKAWAAALVYARTPHPTNPLKDLAVTGTPESRTLAVALAQFIEQVLIHEPDEVTSGEWLSASEARKVLRRLQEPA